MEGQGQYRVHRLVGLVEVFKQYVEYRVPRGVLSVQIESVHCHYIIANVVVACFDCQMQAATEQIGVSIISAYMYRNKGLSLPRF